jgi:hypothetical protein
MVCTFIGMFCKYTTLHYAELETELDTDLRKHYLVTEVLNMWEVSMGGSHTAIDIFGETFSSCQGIFFCISAAEYLNFIKAVHNLCTALAKFFFFFFLFSAPGSK